MCNGKPADECYGEEPVTTHLLFQVEQSVAEDRIFGHYSLLIPSRARAETGGKDVLVLPDAVSWHNWGS